VVGSVATLLGALFAHYAALDEFDEFGREAWTWIPRGWQFELIGQVVSLTGVLLILGGITLAFLWRREMTWARASIGSAVFVSLMLIIFAIIPNQWLTLTQSVWEWTPQKILITIPGFLVLNNEVAISAAAVKDIISGTYSVVMLIAVAVAMYQWQEYTKRATAAPKETISEYGRPLAKVES
jgi:hypothetical protein